MKRANAKILALLLRKFTKEIESLSDAELEDLADSQDPLINKVRPGVRNDKAQTKEEKIDASTIIRALKEFKNRDEGAKYLIGVTPTKGQLTIIAKGLDLPVGKRNSQEEIAAKIIEATIGYRIRSAAIRGAHDEGKQNHSAAPVESNEPNGDKEDAREAAKDEKLKGDDPKADS